MRDGHLRIDSDITDSPQGYPTSFAQAFRRTLGADSRETGGWREEWEPIKRQSDHVRLAGPGACTPPASGAVPNDELDLRGRARGEHLDDEALLLLQALLFKLEVVNADLDLMKVVAELRQPNVDLFR